MERVQDVKQPHGPHEQGLIISSLIYARRGASFALDIHAPFNVLHVSLNHQGKRNVVCPIPPECSLVDSLIFRRPVPSPCNSSLRLDSIPTQRTCNHDTLHPPYGVHRCVWMYPEQHILPHCRSEPNGVWQQYFLWPRMWPMLQSHSLECFHVESAFLPQRDQFRRRQNYRPLSAFLDGVV